MRNSAVAVILVLAIIFLVPIAVYGAMSAITGLQAGTAIAFVLTFHFAKSALAGQWLFYAALWWLIFVLGEIGQAIGPDYWLQEAVAGIV
jgi:hypothetical protein